ncbi:hypothetical protein EAG_13724, partial [Camponotus floridanus]
VIRLLQINLNHTQAAQDLLMQKILKEDIEIVAVQEPWSTANNEYWITSKKGTAAILWNRGTTSFPCKLLMKGHHMVAVKYKNMVIASCYCSPSESAQAFELMLNEIRLLVTQEKNNTIICGDFNAKAHLWSSRVEDARGKDLIEMAHMLNLRLINEGNIATCVRPQGSSIIDITWSTVDISSRIQNWRVEEDDISLSDHRYVAFSV